MPLSADSRSLASRKGSWCVPEYLAELTGEAPELVLEIVTLFLQDTAAGLRLLAEQISRRDPAAAKTLHGLKGSSRQIGGLRLGDIFEEMEVRIGTNGVDPVNLSLNGAESAFHSLRLEMDDGMAALAAGLRIE